MITVLSAHGPVTVQDRGWFGHYRSGVSRSGAMDRLAISLANVLLGNDADAACIEVPLTPLRLRFDVDLDFAIAGADCGATLDGVALPPYWASRARAGQILSLGQVRWGSFAYIAVAGGIDTPLVLGSRSTHLRHGFGGLEGRPLRAGDALLARRTDALLPPSGLGVLPLPPLPVEDESAVGVRVLKAGEHDIFTDESRDAFWGRTWTVSRQSNRAGYRLEGPALPMSETVEMRSHGIVPGAIQVPAGGPPIIQLADAATMGGYPKIGTIIEADLWRAAQVRPGQKLKFIDVDYAGAVGALEGLEAHIAECRKLIESSKTALRKAG